MKDLKSDLEFQAKMRQQFEEFVNNNIMQHINSNVQNQLEMSNKLEEMSKNAKSEGNAARRVAGGKLNKMSFGSLEH